MLVTAARSLGACNANLSVSAVFTRDYTLAVEVYPATIDAEDPNAPAPGVVCAGK